MHRAAGDVVLTLAGELDMLTVTRLSDLVTEVLGDGPARIVLDMAGAKFCDYQGLGTLGVLTRTANHAQAGLVLPNVGDFLTRALDITGRRSALMISTGPPTS